MADEATPALGTAAGVSPPCPEAGEVIAAVVGVAEAVVGARVCAHSTPLLELDAAGKAASPRQGHGQSGETWLCPLSLSSSPPFPPSLSLGLLLPLFLPLSLSAVSGEGLQ